MALTQHIFDRLRATENTEKITRTMETISAVRYQQYYKLWAQSGDFYDALAQMAYLLVTAEKTIDHPLMKTNESGSSAIIAIGSDRGLCGAYNSNIFRLIDVHLNMARRFNGNLKIYAKGSKVTGHLRKRGISLAGVYDDFDELPSVKQVEKMADNFINQYINGQISRLSVVYTRFFSVASQRAQTLTLLPITELIDDLTTRATVIWPWELDFEDFLLSPSAEEIFDSVALMMVRTALTGCFLEAAVSEHLERVIAMRNATDNADEMIENLRRDYNRARQSQITAELLDIIGGMVGG